MKIILTLILAAMGFISASASTYDYTFHNTPISEALIAISKDHPDINISFIYKELDKYKTSARIHTDDTYNALRKVIGSNPISVIRKEENYYIEALQHGKFVYSGRAKSNDNEPVVGATVMLLEPKDSTTITYGVTDGTGRFAIPCDRENIIAKFTCVGYITAYKNCNSFYIGTVVMQEHVVKLDEVNVEAENAHLYADRSVYLPTSKQKNASQTGADLLNHMAIPQLRSGEDLKTVSGRPVEIYIDFIPATSRDIEGMRVSDVKYVEYYDYPIDPRFQGNRHVINFIMQKYEYGGYVKGSLYENFVTSRQYNGFAKLQYKKMTFDWAGGAFFRNDKRNYENTVETFRLPQEDGTLKEFERSSTVNSTQKKENAYWTSLKALYQTEKIAMNNMVTVDIDRTPQHIIDGSVTYSPEDFESADYTSRKSSRINSLIYNGYWHFSLSHGNSITFNPSYAYTHTNQHSMYDEVGFETILNNAIDDSHQASGNLSFVHSFGKAGTLKAMYEGSFLQNKTQYSGTTSTSDKARTYSFGPGVNYSYSDEKFYGNFGTGLSMDKSEYGDIIEKTAAPWVNLSLQYAFNPKNSVSLEFNYGKSLPSASYRSAAVIQSNPLLRYTGNPSLVPYNSYSIDGNYTLIPSNKFNLSVFGFAWIVGNRYVYDYEATPTFILRTIKQPMGDYAQWQYGLQGSTNLFDNNLKIKVSCYMEQAHNGVPYNWNKSKFNVSGSVYYYLGKLYFGATYGTPKGWPDGCMIGLWMKSRDAYTFQVGWGNKNWKLRFFTRNFLRYNTYQTTGVMNSKYYDIIRYIYSGSYAGFFQISATYTFGFGKKVKAGNEAYQATGASSGILK